MCDSVCSEPNAVASGILLRPQPGKRSIADTFADLKVAQVASVIQGNRL